MLSEKKGKFLNSKGLVRELCDDVLEAPSLVAVGNFFEPMGIVVFDGNAHVL